MPSLRQALEDIDSGRNYGHYSIPWEMLAAKQEKLKVASNDCKQPEDSKPRVHCQKTANRQMYPLMIANGWKRGNQWMLLVLTAHSQFKR